MNGIKHLNRNESPIETKLQRSITQNKDKNNRQEESSLSTVDTPTLGSNNIKLEVDTSEDQLIGVGLNLSS